MNTYNRNLPRKLKIKFKKTKTNNADTWAEYQKKRKEERTKKKLFVVSCNIQYKQTNKHKMKNKKCNLLNSN